MRFRVIRLQHLHLIAVLELNDRLYFLLQHVARHVVTRMLATLEVCEEKPHFGKISVALKSV